MNKKTIVITGATAGIGRAAARALARAGHHLVLVGRSAERLNATAHELRNLGAEVETEQCDLALIHATRSAATRLRQRLERIDVLILNAGAVFARRDVTAEGLERSFATNHLAPFVLTAELRDLLVSSGPSRVVITASDAHRFVDHLDFDDLQSERWSVTGFPVYAKTKLANLLFMRELARRLEGSGVVAHAFHPGFVASDLAKNNGFVGKAAMALCWPFARNVEKGADTLVWLASSDDVPGTGAYWFDRRPHALSEAASDAAAAQALWATSEQIVAALAQQSRPTERASVDGAQ